MIKRPRPKREPPKAVGLQQKTSARRVGLVEHRAGDVSTHPIHAVLPNHRTTVPRPTAHVQYPKARGTPDALRILLQEQHVDAFRRQLALDSLRLRARVVPLRLDPVLVERGVGLGSPQLVRVAESSSLFPAHGARSYHDAALEDRKSHVKTHYSKNYCTFSP